ncbi:hypothetical protein KI387_020742, partial [Taxus chinensis]
HIDRFWQLGPYKGFAKVLEMEAQLLVLVLVLLLISLALGAAADGIHGCGGFVEASPALIKLRKPTDPKLDYSHITVELHTIDGLVKESTQCAPNGYYFIPVQMDGHGNQIRRIIERFDRIDPEVHFRELAQLRQQGTVEDYVAEFQRHSIMIPDSSLDFKYQPYVPVSVDHNGCNGNEDINFHFTGFTISGRVLGAVGAKSCPKINEGPGNVKIELISTNSGISNTVFTSQGGSYKFKNITPGTYKLLASHPMLTVEQRGSPEIAVDFDNLVVNDLFFVPGYDIDGLVVSQGNPVLGVHVYIYSDDVVEVHCPQGSGRAPWPEKALCYAISDANGKFAFKSVPCGKYRLLPFYKGENTIFDVSPPSMELLVEHGQVTISQPFQVTGFSVGGRVVNSEDTGVEGVKILVDGRERATTDIQGYYKLDQVTSTRYTIKAEKEHFKFSSLENFMVLPNMASIPDIKATHYNICGSIKLITTGFVGKRQVALTHVPENVKPQIKRTDEMGDFCFEVPPGDYRVSPHTTSLENSSGLLFSPPHFDVTMNAPVLGIEFKQALVDICGSAVCKGRCDTSISVSLSSLSVKNVESSRSISLSSDRSEFVFEKVLPGAYRLEIKRGPSFEASNWDDDWCWEKKVIDVDAGIADLVDITFVQKGYWLHIKSTHLVNASILQPNNEPINVPIEPLYLTGKKYLLSGKIHINSNVSPDANEMSESITVEAWQKDGTFVDVINNVSLVSNPTGSTLNAEAHHQLLADIPTLISEEDTRNLYSKV